MNMNDTWAMKLAKRKFVKPVLYRHETSVTPENLFDEDYNRFEQKNTEHYAESDKSLDIELEHLTEKFGSTIHAADDYHTLCEGQDYILPLADQPHKLQTLSNELRKIFDSIRLVTHLLSYPEPEPLKLYLRGSRSCWAPVKSPNLLLSYVKSFLEDPDFLTSDNYHCEHYKCVADAYLVLKPYRDQLISTNLNPNANIIDVDDKTGALTEISSSLILNQFAKQLHENCNAYQFKEAQRNRDRQVSSQFLSATKYINRLRQHHGRLLVIRIDLHLPTNKKHMGLDVLGKHFFDFLHILRRKQGLHLKGYFWKLEYGAQQSFHYHCLFFLDGRKHSQDIKLAQFIGQTWDKVIGGKNCYFNCHHHKYQNRFRNPVMGRLEPYDDEKYQRLFSVIRYFCKKDQFIVHRNCKGKRTIGMGQIKPSKSKCKNT